MYVIVKVDFLRFFKKNGEAWSSMWSLSQLKHVVDSQQLNNYCSVKSEIAKTKELKQSEEKQSKKMIKNLLVIVNKPKTRNEEKQMQTILS